MVREIVKDTEFLQTISKRADINSEETQRIIQDLIDTANANRDENHCVGLAAIQIGEPVRVVVALKGETFVPFVNPVIKRYYGGEYLAEEGCLSLEGTRTVNRHDGIELFHQTKKGVKKQVFTGFLAQIIQHEIDHLNGKLI